MPLNSVGKLDFGHEIRIPHPLVRSKLYVEQARDRGRGVLRVVIRRLRKIEENFAASNPKRESKDLWRRLNSRLSNLIRLVRSRRQRNFDG